jgi:hypothetical protein
MERENFLYKITGSFAFNTGDKDITIITEKLGIKPTWSFNKGDEHLIKRTNKVLYRPYGIWGYDVKPIFTDVTDISPMIQSFKDLLSDKIEIIKELIDNYKFECDVRITIWIEEEGACEAGLNREELLFLTNFSYFVISYVQVENVETISS